MISNVEDKKENIQIAIFAKLLLVLTVITFILSLVISVNWLNKPGNFPFKKVELINQLENQESNELQLIAAKALNGGFFSLNVDEFRAELLDKLPWIKSVSVRKIWPDKLAVEITEYKPVVRWKLVDNTVQKKTNDYQLLSQNGIAFKPKLTEKQKLKFNRMALFSGPELSEKKVLDKCFEINKNLKTLDLGIEHCGMNKRRTWRLVLLPLATTNGANSIDIKLGKDNIIQKLERFIQIFSGKLKQYLNSVEYVDLRYSNGFSIKWNTSNTLQNIYQQK